MVFTSRTTALALLFLILPNVTWAVDAPAHGDSVMVVTADPRATSAALGVLRAGGNATDAAITAAFALAVAEPYSSGLGGGGFFVTFSAADGRIASLDARETAPMAAHRDMYLVGGKADPQLSRYGSLAVGVPGLVRGLGELYDRDASLPWADLIAPALALAADGMLVSPMLHDRIASRAHLFNEAARTVFLVDGNPPAVGSLLRQPDLARTLRLLADQGPDAFYRGDIAAALVATAGADGRGLTGTDLADYRVRWREPVRGTYRGLKIHSMAPPSSGGVHLIEMLNILDGFDLTALGYGSAASWHLLAEAMKFAYADRSRFLGDTDFVDVPVSRLTAVGYADSLRRRIDPARALPPAEIEGAALVPTESDETSHLSVIDAAGNAVAATLTINLVFGSGLVADGTGIVLNDEMDDFVAAPGSPNAFGLIGDEANAVAPGKRPLSSMTPTIVLQDGRVRMITGSPGGSKIISTTLQTIINVVDHGMDALQAVSVPRIHHQWYPPFLYHEFFGLSPDTRAILESMGHELQERSVMCNAQIIVINPESGERTGASDPRGFGRAAGF